MQANGSGSKEILLHGDRKRFPCSWSPDGQDLLFDETGPAGDSLWRSSRGLRNASPVLLIRPTSGECGLFSPNGKWVAYVSSEPGRAEVYVDRYPSLGEKVAVSTDGGNRPRWSRDSRELFYRQGDEDAVFLAIQHRR
jgi:eukaryotic-like serine/threonine-protein kinase